MAKEVRISVSYDENEDGIKILDRVQELLDSASCNETESLIIGEWNDAYDTSCQPVVDLLAENSNKLPNLKQVFIGDMSSEECEISWIQQAGYGSFLKCFPQLEVLHLKGSEGLELGELDLPQLKSLFIECGGMPKTVLQSIAMAKLPKLESLKLYIGIEDYGFDGDLEDIKKIIDKKDLPNLKYLGLMDSEIQDEIAEAVANAEIVDQLEVLDLSLGTLSDKGAGFLLNSDKINTLKVLNLEYNYLSDQMKLKLDKLEPEVNTADTQDDDEWKYPAVTE